MSGRTSALALAALLSSGTLAAQDGVSQFSHDQLRFSAMQIEAGVLTSSRLKGAATIGLRADLGRFAPRIRLLAGLSYFRSDFKASEVDDFEAALARVVTDPEGNFTIDLGTLRWGDFVLDADLQYLLTTGGQWRPYVGAGASVHFRNGSGTAIDGTFVEDALDTIGAGFNFTLGTDVLLSPQLYVNMGGRAVVASDLSTIGLHLGLGYRLPGSGP